jgi:hypothetical protein
MLGSCKMGLLVVIFQYIRLTTRSLLVIWILQMAIGFIDGQKTAETVSFLWYKTFWKILTSPSESTEDKKFQSHYITAYIIWGIALGYRRIYGEYSKFRFHSFEMDISATVHAFPCLQPSVCCKYSTFCTLFSEELGAKH